MIKVKANFTLEQAINAERGSRGIALLLLNLGAGWGWVDNTTPRPLYPLENTVPIVSEAVGALEPFWTGAENLAPHRDSIPGRSSP